MDPKEIDHVLSTTLEDRRLSRGESHAIKALIRDERPDDQRLAFYRHRAFELAKAKLIGRDDILVVEWLEDVVKALVPTGPAGPSVTAEVVFSPGDDCLNALIRNLKSGRQTADICVFTITDNRVSRVIEDAHDRGVKVRIITDDDKSLDRGSDASRLSDAGIEVRYDNSPHHMHHKFAVMDGRLVLTGSYNWTRSAAEHNQENLLVSDDPRLVRPYVDAFERLWVELDIR